MWDSLVHRACTVGGGEWCGFQWPSRTVGRFRPFHGRLQVVMECLPSAPATGYSSWLEISSAFMGCRSQSGSRMQFVREGVILVNSEPLRGRQRYISARVVIFSKNWKVSPAVGTSLGDVLLAWLVAHTEPLCIRCLLAWKTDLGLNPGGAMCQCGRRQSGARRPLYEKLAWLRNHLKSRSVGLNGQDAGVYESARAKLG